MLVTLRDHAVVRVLSSYGSRSATVVEGAVYGKPIDGEGPIPLPTALPTAASELRAGLPAPVPVRLVLPVFPGMTAYDALYSVGGPTPVRACSDRSITAIVGLCAGRPRRPCRRAPGKPIVGCSQAASTCSVTQSGLPLFICRAAWMDVPRLEVGNALL